MVADEGPDARAEADRLIDAGNAAEEAGRIGDACECYRRAVAAAPRHARAHLNLGIGLEASGEIDAALQSFESAHALDPASAAAGYNLGRLLFARGAVARAEALLRSALEQRPDFPQASVVLASAYEAQDKLEAALGELESALAKHPDWAGALRNYSAVLRKLGRMEASEDALRRTLNADPEDADACCELAGRLCARGALDEARELLLRALQLEPDFAEARFALADVFDAQGDLRAAAASLELALTQRPDWAQALNNYGLVLQRLQRLDDAETALRRAIDVEPKLSKAYQTLGAILVNQCRIAEALDVFRMGREHDPQSFDLESAELFTLNLSDEVSCDVLFERHKAFGIRVERAYPRRFDPLRNTRDTGRRLRIGYVSGDFGRHAVTRFTLPLIERHDRSAFEIYCYSTGAIEDEQTRNVRSRTDVWRAAAAMSPSELADAVNRDRIDILVDLSGHSGRSSLVAFAEQPAPVQTTWLGYLGTTGMTRVRYRICDRHTDPSEAEALHTETLVRLPNSQWCYRPLASLDCTSAPEPPCRANRYVTFGSFNHVPKLSTTTRRLWAAILEEVRGSRLVVVGVPEGRVREDLIGDLASAGIDAARISVLGRLTFQEYFAWFNAVDVALDTTPYSGGTTTLDALWMGVPVLTAPGCRPVSRSAAGILSVLGLDAWIATSPADYVQRAARFARADDVLADLRATLRRRMRDSALMDEQRFTLDMEAAYREMWRTWCEGAGPE